MHESEEITYTDLPECACVRRKYAVCMEMYATDVKRFTRVIFPAMMVIRMSNYNDMAHM